MKGAAVIRTWRRLLAEVAGEGSDHSSRWKLRYRDEFESAPGSKPNGP